MNDQQIFKVNLSWKEGGESSPSSSKHHLCIQGAECLWNSSKNSSSKKYQKELMILSNYPERTKLMLFEDLMRKLGGLVSLRKCMYQKKKIEGEIKVFKKYLYVLGVQVKQGLGGCVKVLTGLPGILWIDNWIPRKNLNLNYSLRYFLHAKNTGKGFFH